jgi:hypothetical protein
MKPLYFGSFICFVAIFMATFTLPTLDATKHQHRLMVKYGRQIPTAPAYRTVMWHVKNGD